MFEKNDFFVRQKSTSPSFEILFGHYSIKNSCLISTQSTKAALANAPPIAVLVSGTAPDANEPPSLNTAHVAQAKSFLTNFLQSHLELIC